MTREENLQYRAAHGYIGDNEIGVNVTPTTNRSPFRETGRLLRLAEAAGRGLNGWEAQYEQTRVSDPMPEINVPEADNHVAEALTTVFGGEPTMYKADAATLAVKDQAYQATELPRIRAALADLSNGNRE